ncbi:MAG TPA: hypothetical protein VNX21_09680 [Candidatus Thermoplasmatota archaeon]|nr:hypothetical protein [Candidatus Thermoplasmatota archaeon]
MTLAPSETAYFHPARFAREKKLLDAVGLPHTDRKYDGSELGGAVLLAAILGAEEAGALRLEVGKTARIFGLRKVDAVLVHAGPKADAFPAGTLEAAAREAVAAGPKDAEAVVEAMLREDAPDPYAWATWLVARGLAARGLLEVVETRTLKVFRAQAYVVPDATRALAAATSPEPVRALLDRAQAQRPDVWRLLQEGLKRGASDRTERDSGDGPD